MHLLYRTGDFTTELVSGIWFPDLKSDRVVTVVFLNMLTNNKNWLLH